MKIIFENYAGELMNDEQKEFIAKLKRAKYSHLIFSPRHLFGIDFETFEINNNEKDVVNDALNILEVESASHSEPSPGRVAAIIETNSLFSLQVEKGRK